MRRHGPPEKASNRGRTAAERARDALSEVKGNARDSASGGRVDRRSKRGGSIARDVSVANAPARMIRKSTYEQSAHEIGRRRALQPLGRRGDAPSLIAKRVQQLACTADVVVWLHDDLIFAAPAGAAAKVPPGSLIGLYGAGVLLAEIERDLGRSSGTARTASRC